MPDDNKILLAAHKVTQPIGVFYLASMAAGELTKIAKADIRRMIVEQDPRRAVERYLGIQRPLRDDRVKEIKQYVLGADATFPTSVILSVNTKCADWDDDRQILTLAPYEADPSNPDDVSIPIGKIANILDGQHRVKGLEDWSPANGEFDVPVSIFVGSDIATDSNIFATVNLTQTKVNRSLTYDLFDLAKTRSPQRTAHDIAVALDISEGSPVHKRIKRLGVATPGRVFETLTQATVVETLLPYLSGTPMEDRQLLLKGRSLEWPKPSEANKYIFRTLFIQKKDDIIADTIWNYLDAVKKRWPEAWEEASRGAVLPKTNGFRALMRLLRPVFYTLKKKPGDSLKTGEVFAVFSKSKLKDEDINTSNFPPGTSGEAALYKHLVAELDLSVKPL